MLINGPTDGQSNPWILLVHKKRAALYLALYIFTELDRNTKGLKTKSLSGAPNAPAMERYTMIYFAILLCTCIYVLLKIRSLVGRLIYMDEDGVVFFT